MHAFQFDRAYYQKWYENEETRTFAREETPRTVDFVFSYLEYLELNVKSLLDVGCGLGFWRDATRARDRAVVYTGLEISDYLCAQYGWHKGSIVDYHPEREFDLVVCQSVLQYLNAPDCERAIRNITALCSQALFLEIPTRKDLAEVCLEQRTDMSVYRRTAQWYRRLLRRDFLNVGGGLFVKRSTGPSYYELWALE